MIQDKLTDSYPVPMIGVAGIVFNNQQQVLLIRRNQRPAAGLWSVPGGKLEAGETLVDACRREIQEETGLNVDVKTITAVVERRLEGFHYVIMDFLALPSGEEDNAPVAQSDAADARWVGLENLPDYPLVTGLPEIIMRTFNAYRRGLATGLYDVNGTGADFILR
ncbi:MAG: NUDIX domain-containing protein [Methylovulum sp.]|nr:NUDIX domain-containing protein [Methylovulum sp.]